MQKRILIPSLALGALTLSAPPAVAASPTYDCNAEVVQDDTATGQNWEGAAWGYVADSDGDAVTIECVITVNGSEAASTPLGSGTGVATTQGRLTFAAEDTDNVRVCARVTAGYDVAYDCFPVERHQLVPQEVLDAIDGIMTIPAVLLCPRMRSYAGDYGPVHVGPDGDITVGDRPLLRCPPY